MGKASSLLVTELPLITPRRELRRLGDETGPGGPLWLWLGENGMSLGRSTWRAVFRRANERCARFGLDFNVHPHTLRHTFAVPMLGLCCVRSSAGCA